MKREKEILWATSCIYAKNSAVSAHSHDFYHYFYMKDGEGKIRIGEQWYVLKRGHLYLMPPGVIHEIHAGEIGLCAYEIKFRFDENGLLSSLKSEIVTNDNRIEATLEFIFNEFRSESSHKERMLDLKLDELLILILRCSEDKPERAGINFSKKFADVLFYMEQHLAEEISLQTLADVAHLEKIYFLKQFKAEMKLTPMAYLRNMRISESKKLLLHSDMNVTQISAAVGFPDVHHFSSCFKRLVGQSPKEYKEQAEKKLHAKITNE